MDQASFPFPKRCTEVPLITELSQIRHNENGENPFKEGGAMFHKQVNHNTSLLMEIVTIKFFLFILNFKKFIGV